MKIVLLLSALLLYAISLSSHAAELHLSKTTQQDVRQPASQRQPDQLPDSSIGFGTNNIRSAWFAGATSRYQHGILGDAIEASALVVETADGTVLKHVLPQSKVFEDLQPRVADLDGDGNDEVVVIESDIAQGASLAIYGIQGHRLQRITATQYLGQPYRWLNPVGFGDFNGDGSTDIALVATPHIGNVLRLYSYTSSQLQLYASFLGVSNHAIGSVELDLGAVVTGADRDLLIVPNQNHNKLMVLQWTDHGINSLFELALPGKLHAMQQMAEKRWLLKITDNTSTQYYQLSYTD